MPENDTPKVAHAATLTAFVRAAGSDLDDMGPPRAGSFYMVLELPCGDNPMIHEAMISGRIQVHAAPKAGPS